MIIVLHQPKASGTSLRHLLMRNGINVGVDNIYSRSLSEHISKCQSEGELVTFVHANPTPENLKAVEGHITVYLSRSTIDSARSIVHRHRHHSLNRIFKRDFDKIHQWVVDFKRGWWGVCDHHIGFNQCINETESVIKLFEGLTGRSFQHRKYPRKNYSPEKKEK